jgi:hypothetical protein
MRNLGENIHPFRRRQGAKHPWAARGLPGRRAAPRMARRSSHHLGHSRQCTRIEPAARNAFPRVAMARRLRHRAADNLAAHGGRACRSRPPLGPGFPPGTVTADSARTDPARACIAKKSRILSNGCCGTFTRGPRASSPPPAQVLLIGRR